MWSCSKARLFLTKLLKDGGSRSNRDNSSRVFCPDCPKSSASIRGLVKHRLAHYVVAFCYCGYFCQSWDTVSRHKTKTDPDKMCPVYNRLNRSDEERQWVFLVDPCAYHFFCKWHHLKYSHFGRQLPAEFPASKMLSMSDARQREWAVYHDPQE